MIAVIDTNILARFLIGDDPAQGTKAERLFSTAKKIIIPTVVFCELCWVMSAVYKQPASFIASGIRGILTIANVEAKTDEITAGLKMLDDGGDFADGVIAYTGGLMAGESSTFVSFDKQAVKKLSARGLSALDADA
ncbi:MAG: type II toxin-antitoxin system VapC family toxin [Azonexus sp.]|jgi:predicted nucleic-acid-binding protein|nr:type II toxin-antitoxin system VapC family toxin [Azonexus sp.]